MYNYLTRQAYPIIKLYKNSKICFETPDQYYELLELGECRMTG